MKKRRIYLILLCLGVAFVCQNSYSQSFLKKLKEKAEDAAVDRIVGGNSSSNNSGSNNSNSGSNSGTNVGGNSVQNNQGGGLSKDAPDVQANIKSAKDAYSSKNYADARYSARQAIQGIELEIGQNILKSLPSSLDGLSLVAEEDKVTSSGIGFVGLLIYRTYQTTDKQFTVTIQNDAAMYSSLNMYFSNSAYTASNNPDTKQTKLKGYKAIIKYDQSSGYTISVPIGQSSIILLNGVNYATESSFMNAASQIDIDKIKNELGEK